MHARILTGLLGAALLCAVPISAQLMVTNTANAGAGSLRSAITQANALPGFDLIAFSIPGPGVQTIVPLTPLPALTDAAGALVDGFTQPGAGPGANPPATATLLIEIDGSLAVGGADGISIQSDNNIVQGLVVNRFQLDGIHILGGIAQFTANNNTVFANFVGTDPTGTIDLGNGTVLGPGLFGGIHVSNVQGGTARDNIIDSNLVSGNWSDGVWIQGPFVPGYVGSNDVINNFIGTDITGTVDLGNDHEGVTLTEGTVDNLVDSNLISGNDTDGVGIQGFNNIGFGPPIQTSNNQVSANLIGLDINLNPLPNTLHGVAIGEYGPTQWGCADLNTVSLNVIAYNGRAGVSVVEDSVNNFNADNNQITQNAIWMNGTLGIDLGNNGVTFNDPGDPDTGANEELNFPVILNVASAAGVTTIVGTSPTPATVEIFRSDMDPSGFGQGAWYLGSTTPDAAGNWMFVTDRLVPADFATATATDSFNNTSEFCQNQIVPGTPSLTSANRNVALRLGNPVNFTLNAGAAEAGSLYAILGGVTGVTPGTPLPPLGAVTLPLNLDPFTSLVLTLSGSPFFMNFVGTLDASGSATAQLNLPPLPPALSGLVMHYAALTINPFSFASNPVAIELMPW